MNRDDVGLHRCLPITAVYVYLHAEGLRYVGNLPSDVSVSDDSYGFARQLDYGIYGRAEIIRSAPLA